MTVFKKIRGAHANRNQLTGMVDMLQAQVGNSHIVTPAIAKSALAMESLSDTEQGNLQQAGVALEAALESIVANLGIAVKPTRAQVEAGTIAGVLGGDYQAFLTRKLDMPLIGTESMGIVNANVADGLDARSFGLEAYDDRENRNAVIYSIAYNYQAARQDEFGEAFFPTITLAPDQVGFGVSVDLMMVYDGYERKVAGTFEDFKKKNIIRAVADPSVLKKEQTRVTPVHRAQSAAMFSADFAPTAVVIEGESILTAPLAFGKKLDLLGISQTDALLTTGVMDQTDTLDPTINLKNVYAVFGADKISIPVSNLPLSNFTYSTQNNKFVQTLSFSTTSVLLNKDSKNVDGSAFAVLNEIATNNLVVRLEVAVNGTVNIETGELVVYGNTIAVHSVQDANGNLLDLSAGVAAALVADVAAGKLSGYDLQAYRTNVNRRQRGQLIDVTKYTQLYNVPLRSPITAMHPATVDGQTDASDVQALITATRIRTSNESVATLLTAASTLKSYVDSRDETGTGPDVLGVGRFFVRPAFMYEDLDVTASIDSLKSHERARDIQAVLINKLRDMAYRLYRDSEYKAAADALAGGIAPVPTVVIGTDPVIARYINVEGDLRTLGGEFNVQVVSTLDVRMKGKIAVAFASMDENRNTQPSPLNFGNMVWAPELVLTANLSRGNTYSRETVVQPRFLFIVNTPVMGLLEVKNIPDTLNKVPLNMHTV